MKAFIKQLEPIGTNQALALVQLVHAPGEDITQNFGASVSAATDREYMSVSGSASIIDDGRTHTYARVIMQRMQDVKDVAEVTEMRALSKNMYLDQNERMWTIRKSESGQDVLVRNQDINDNAELLEMLRSVSSATPEQLRSQNPEVAHLYANHNLLLAGAVGGDMVSFVSNSGEVKVGFVAAQVTDDNSFLVVDREGNEEQITSKSMVALVDGDELDPKQFPQLDSLSAAGGVDTQKLLDYYAQVFRYAPEYYEQLAARILAHNF
ncbi:hypothetical protein pEaSNUABM5_00188 [Erwinia phage pEa_SNUABM_5]|uniref:Uncharacterized protein n=1 Tax=Erwinia phage pEa_SNUABM_5 TaxID=2797313 RepID=A0A7T8IVP5_9CAUD|nr:hypothetical protein MPK73_gp188 [Erwinia phage pEa_SNUABM_5]QQO90330.1 hypothetical protein pEaSNUABM5_00188 [Erwinia phage pEa_SNUABM_5]